MIDHDDEIRLLRRGEPRGAGIDGHGPGQTGLEADVEMAEASFPPKPERPEGGVLPGWFVLCGAASISVLVAAFG